MQPDNNPYTAPQSDLVKPRNSENAELLTIPNALPAGHGMQWITAGWEFFKNAPLGWILVLLIILGVSFVAAFIPLGSILINIVFPVLIAGILIGCQQADNGTPFQVETMFQGFKIEQRNRLLGLGGLYIGFSIVMGVLLGIYMVSVVGAGGGFGGEEQFMDFMRGAGFPIIIIGVLVLVALSIPVMMAFWFAPALIAFHDLSLGDSLKLSFKGCLRNIVPFLLYGIVMLIITVIGMIPFGLGLFVTSSIMFASIYASYKDIFVVQSSS